MQDMTFEADENNFNEMYLNDRGTFEYEFSNYDDMNKYCYPCKHFINDHLSCKYKKGVNKVFYKSDKQERLSFVLYYVEVVEDGGPTNPLDRKRSRFDIISKYNEKENTFQLTLADIFMSIDVSLRFKNMYYHNCIVVNIIKSERPSYNFELITSEPCEYFSDLE